MSTRINPGVSLIMRTPEFSEGNAIRFVLSDLSPFFKVSQKGELVPVYIN